MITAFLTQSSDSAQGGRIITILKQMIDDMEYELGSITAEETKAIKDYEVLMATKTKEANVLRKEIEVKNARIGEFGLQLATKKDVSQAVPLPKFPQRPASIGKDRREYEESEEHPSRPLQRFARNARQLLPQVRTLPQPIRVRDAASSSSCSTSSLPQPIIRVRDAASSSSCSTSTLPQPNIWGRDAEALAAVSRMRDAASSSSCSTSTLPQPVIRVRDAASSSSCSTSTLPQSIKVRDAASSSANAEASTTGGADSVSMGVAAAVLHASGASSAKERLAAMRARIAEKRANGGNVSNGRGSQDAATVETQMDVDSADTQDTQTRLDSIGPPPKYLNEIWSRGPR